MEVVLTLSFRTGNSVGVKAKKAYAAAREGVIKELSKQLPVQDKFFTQASEVDSIAESDVIQLASGGAVRR